MSLSPFILTMPRRAAYKMADTVRLWNSRGQILAGAVISEGIKPGVICIHEGAWPDLDLTADGICKNGAVNVLTKRSPQLAAGEWLCG